MSTNTRNAKTPTPPVDEATLAAASVPRHRSDRTTPSLLRIIPALKKLTVRVLILVLVLFIVSVLAFLLGVLGPGDPIEAQYGNALDQAQLEALRDSYGLNGLIANERVGAV